jgi:hypothetical protein
MRFLTTWRRFRYFRRRYPLAASADLWTLSRRTR